MSGPELKYKTVAVKGLEVVDEAQGIVQAYVAGIGNKDHGGDIILPGAFEDGFAGGLKPKGVWSHDWTRPVSKTLEIYEVPAGDARLPEKMKAAGIGGLFVKTQFNLKTQDGRDAFENVMFYDDESEWSIGYKTDEEEWDKDRKANLLKKVSLFEYSPVLFGMNPLTATVGIKVLTDNQGNVTVQIDGVDDPKTREAIADAVKSTMEGGDDDPQLTEAPEVATPDAKSDEGGEEGAEGGDASADDEDAGGAPEGEKPEGDGADDEQGDETEGKSAEAEGDEPEVKISSAVEAFMTYTGSSTFNANEAKMLGEFIAERSEKALAGSYEERRQELSEAVRSAFASGDDHEWIYVYATFDSSLVYMHETYDDGYTSKYFQVTYSKNDDGTYNFGEPSEVEVVEVVMAKQAVVDAAFKGHAEEVKSLLQPFVDVATSAEGDADVKAAIEEGIEAKIGAVLSKKNRTLVEQAHDALGKLLEDTDKQSDDTEEVETDEKVEPEGDSKSDENAEGDAPAAPEGEEDPGTPDEEVEEKSVDFDEDMKFLTGLAKDLGLE